MIPQPNYAPPTGWRRDEFGPPGAVRRVVYAPPWSFRPPKLEPEQRLGLSAEYGGEIPFQAWVRPKAYNPLRRLAKLWTQTIAAEVLLLHWWSVRWTAPNRSMQISTPQERPPPFMLRSARSPISSVEFRTTSICSVPNMCRGISRRAPGEPAVPWGRQQRVVVPSAAASQASRWQQSTRASKRLVQRYTWIASRWNGGRKPQPPTSTA